MPRLSANIMLQPAHKCPVYSAGHSAVLCFAGMALVQLVQPGAATLGAAAGILVFGGAADVVRKLSSDTTLQPVRFVASVVVGVAVVALLHRSQQHQLAKAAKKLAKDEDAVPARSLDPDWQVVSASDRYAPQLPAFPPECGSLLPAACLSA